jgi:hypothetical protein
MSFVSWLRALRRRSRTVARPGSFVPRLDVLEDRTLPSGVSFSPPVQYSFNDGESSFDGPTALAVGDFNGDGKPDLVLGINGYASTSLALLIGNGDGTFQAPRYFTGGAQVQSLAVGDFNGDGKTDLVVTSFGFNPISVLLGNGDGTFQAQRPFGAGFRATFAAVGDFNGDGKPDLVTASPDFSTNGVNVWLGNGDGTFQPARTFATGGAPGTVVVADFNGDGRPDLAVANNGGGSVSELLGNGDGTFQPAQAIAPWAFRMAVGDLNGDGIPDLVLTHGGFGNVSLLLGHGDGTFQSAQTSAEFGSVTVGDFNGDGRPDLAGNNGSGIGVLQGNGDGTFQPAQNFAAGIAPFFVSLGDFNGDSRPDLAVANPSARRVIVLLNALPTATTVSGPASSTYAQSVTYTATVTNDATPVTAGTVTFLDGNTPISSALPLDANGQASFSTAMLTGGSHTIVASYSGTPDRAGTTGFGPSAGSTGLTVAPLPLSAAAVNFSPTAGAPFTGAVATFANPDPFGGAASYTAVIDWGDGSTSVGAVSGSGTLTVSGTHTYADPGNYALGVQISHNLGNTTTANVYPTATVTSLGQSVQDGLTGDIGFWNNKNGQALINAFNGGPDATALSSWLATAFPNLFGSLSGASNAGVATFYKSQFAPPGSNLAAEVLATALNVYATTQSLGGSIGQAYGFTVTATGLGADSFNVGANGAAFGVANNSTLNVYELLTAVDQQSRNGVLYGGDPTLRQEANDLFDILNKAGAIS